MEFYYKQAMDKKTAQGQRFNPEGSAQSCGPLEAKVSFHRSIT